MQYDLEKLMNGHLSMGYNYNENVHEEITSNGNVQLIPVILKWLAYLEVFLNLWCNKCTERHT